MSWLGAEPGLTSSTSKVVRGEPSLGGGGRDAAGSWTTAVSWLLDFKLQEKRGKVSRESLFSAQNQSILFHISFQ